MAQTVKNLPVMQEIWVPGWGRSSGEGNGSPLQYLCLENFMDRGARWATVHGGRKKSDTTEHAHATPYLGISKTAVWGHPTLKVSEWQS